MRHSSFSSDSSSSSHTSSSGSSSAGSSYDLPTPPRSTSPLAPPDIRRGSSQSTNSTHSLGSSSNFLGWQPSSQHHQHSSTKTSSQTQEPITPPWSPDCPLGAFAVESPADRPSSSTHRMNPLGDRLHPAQYGPNGSTSLWQSQRLFGLDSFPTNAPSSTLDDDDDDDDSRSGTDSVTTYSARSSLDSRTSLEDQDQDTLSPCPPVCVVSEVPSLSSSGLSSPSSPPPQPPSHPPSLSLEPLLSSQLTYALSNPLLHGDILPKENVSLSALSPSHLSSVRSYHHHHHHHHHRRHWSYRSPSSHFAPRLPLSLKLVHTAFHILIPCLTFFILGSIALWAAGTVYYYLGLWIFGFWSDAYKHCFWVMVGLACLGFAYYGFWLVVKIGSGLADTWDIDLHALDDFDWVDSFVTVDPRSVNPQKEQDLELGVSYRNRSASTSRAWSFETERVRETSV
ncbi:hypothetical protein [Phaffia rhodozyma]|uniref:Uncharacterized protein n=1 Tax=Phaffia rhodozyma TaxID=264483 RepID=A0A0F7SPD2_PHARH|nr:hypothetical protein [Phaffia rhodozyma]